MTMANLILPILSFPLYRHYLTQLNNIPVKQKYPLNDIITA